MLFKDIKIGEEFDFNGTKWKRIQLVRVPVMLGFACKNIEKVVKDKGFMNGYIHEDQEVSV